jgi:hypothetical protein
VNLRRWLVACVLTWVAVGAAAPLGARASTPNVSASRYDVVIDVQPDGSLDIVERITLTVGAKPITWFERNVPDGRTDGLSEIVALMDGRNVPVVERGRGVRVRQRRGIEARWEFDPIANTSRTFELRYRAAHALGRDGQGPRLLWTALPSRHDYPIAATSVTLRAPKGTLALAVSAKGGEIRPATSWEDGLVVTGNDLGRNDTVVLDVTFGPRTITPVEPAWVVRDERARRITPAFVMAGLTLVAIGIGTLLMIQVRIKRTVVLEDVEGRPADAADAPPAVATVLLNKGHASGWLAMQAAFYRLVRDGLLIVEKSPSAGGWLRGRSFVVKTGVAGIVQPHEQWILDGVANAGESADLRRLTSRLMRRTGGFQTVLKRELDASGRLDADRTSTSDGLLLAGFVLLGLAVISAVVLAALFAERYGLAILAMPLGVFVDALMFVLTSRGISALSEAGEREAARWRARVTDLRQVIREKAAGRSLHDFEQWLPVAIGAGLGGQWLKAFDAQLKMDGADIAWMKSMGTPEDAHASLAMMVAISGASHSGGAGAGGAGGGGGSSSAG